MSKLTKRQMIALLKGFSRSKQLQESSRKILSQVVERNQQTYTVRPGDSLSLISKKFYQNALLWPLLAATNSIENPDKIDVGQQLIIPAKRSLNSEEQLILSSYQSKEPKSLKEPSTSSTPEVELDSDSFHQKMIQNSLIREEQIERLGLIDLGDIDGIIIKHNHSRHAHPRFVPILEEALNLPYIDYIRVTEAFPATVRHQTRAHYNGKAIDFTIAKPEYADQLCRFLRSKGLYCLNEYDVDTKYKTGGHIHVHF